MDLFDEAVQFAVAVHKGQKRKLSGLPADDLLAPSHRPSSGRGSGGGIYGTVVQGEILCCGGRLDRRRGAAVPKSYI